MAGGQASSQGQSGKWVDGKTQQGLNPAVGEHKGLRKDNAFGCLAKREARVWMPTAKVRCLRVWSYQRISERHSISK